MSKKYTREQLEGMSDLDLNIKIAYMIYRDLGGRDYTQYLTRYHSPEQGCDVIAYCGSELDYCNSWADMGPLISEHDIDLINDRHNDDKRECTATENAIDYNDGCQAMHSIHENILRAAAIVYLLMQGGE